MPSFDFRFIAAALLALSALSSCATSNEVVRPCPTYGVLTGAETLTGFSGSAQEPINVAYRATLANTELKCTYRGLTRRSRGGALPTPGNYSRPGGESSGGYLSLNLAPRETSALDCQADSDSSTAGSAEDSANSGGDQSADQDTQPRRGRRARTVHVTGDFKFDLVVSKGPALSGTKITVPYFVAVMRNQKYILAREQFTETIDLGSKSQIARRLAVPIDIPLAAKMTGASYQVVVGLELTPEQLAYSRQHPQP